MCWVGVHKLMMKWTWSWVNKINTLGCIQTRYLISHTCIQLGSIELLYPVQLWLIVDVDVHVCACVIQVIHVLGTDHVNTYNLPQCLASCKWRKLCQTISVWGYKTVWHTHNVAMLATIDWYKKSMDVRCACLVVVVVLVCPAVGLRRGEGALQRIRALTGSGSGFSVYREEHSTLEEITSQARKASAPREGWQ